MKLIHQWLDSPLKSQLCGKASMSWRRHDDVFPGLYLFQGLYILKYIGILRHDYDIIMGTMASQITSLTIVYSIVYQGTDQRKHQSSAPLAFVREIHRRPVNSQHKWAVTRKMFPFDDVIMFFVSHEHTVIMYPFLLLPNFNIIFAMVCQLLLSILV